MANQAISTQVVSTQTVSDLVKNSPDWRTVVRKVVDYCCNINACFSSGEIALALRLHRTDLRFSVLTLGEYVRDLFYSGSILYKDAQGGVAPALQVPRVTQGIGRTPAGIQVFVYGPDQASALAHPFEVDIPAPGGKALPPAPPKASKPVLTTKALSATFTAKVHTDRRLCIPRAAFEEYAHLSGFTFRGGDPVYLTMGTTQATIKHTQDPGAKSYDLSATRGRVLFPSQDPSNPFEPGDEYKVLVTKDGMTVDLT